MRDWINLIETKVIKLSGFGSRNPDSPAAKFMRAYEEATSDHPLNNRARLHGYSSLELRRDTSSPDNTIWISDIMSLEPGKGHASETLRGLCQLADQFGVSLTLGAKAYGPKHLSSAQLVGWYKRYGFTITHKAIDADDATDMKRKPHHAPHTDVTPLDENAELPTIVYHGTTKANWETEHEAGVMYFTSHRDDAENYAEEASIATDGEEEPIVVEFKIEDLIGLQGSGAHLQPDWGWTDGFKDGAEPSWEDSLRAVGSFAVEPFLHAFKMFGKITPAT